MEINTEYLKLFAIKEDGLFWFWVRIGRYGVAIKNAPLLFSQRQPNSKCITIKGITFSILPKIRINQ